MEDTYTVGSHNRTELVNRGKNTYGSKVDNSVCECPVCYGGKRLGLLACNNCKGTGVVENAGAEDGKEVLECQEEIQKEGKNPTKDKKKTGPFYESGK